MQRNPGMDVADIKLDTRITVMRPLHARSLCKVYYIQLVRNFPWKLITANSWRAAGITDAVKDARATVSDILDPFAALRI